MAQNLQAGIRFNTKAIDGYRWHCSKWGSEYTATPQKRCIDDNGKPYFVYCTPKARFDTPEDRDKFIAAFTAKGWAE
jgi:hypothetical protein